MKSISILFIYMAMMMINACCPPFCDNERDTLNELGEAIRDDDEDGWFSNDTNQRVRLKLVSVTWPRNGKFRIVVDSVRYPRSNNLSGVVRVENPSTTLNSYVATRFVGTWLLQAEDQLISFKSSITISQLEPAGLRVSKEIFWRNREEQLDIEIPSDLGPFYLTFRTVIEKFADPDPQDAYGDSDRDHIPDQWESALAEKRIGIGDPESRDILFVVGYTHSDWKMTSQTKQLLCTRFKQHGINLYIANSDDCGISLIKPGRMSPQDNPIDVDFSLSLDSVVNDMREKYIAGHCRDYAHLLVLAKEIPPPPGRNILFGRSDGNDMSKNIVVRSHLFPPILGPGVQDYQAKTIMHELGHNFGLGHPGDAGSSVMGTPATDMDNLDIIAMLTNAWDRPLDYTSSEWENLSLIP